MGRHLFWIIVGLAAMTSAVARAEDKVRLMDMLDTTPVYSAAAVDEQLSPITNSIVAATNLLTVATNALDTATNKVASLTTTLETATNTLNSATNNIASISNVLATATNMLTTATNTLQSTTNTLDSLVKTMEGATNALVAATNTLVSATNGLTSVSNTLVSVTNTLVEVTNVLVSATNDIANLSSSIVSATNALVQAKRVAMFIIPVNATPDAATYMGFELKASTNNFAYAERQEYAYDEGSGIHLQFWGQSAIADTGANNVDKMWLFVETCYWTSPFQDGRSYLALGNTATFPFPLVSVIVLVDASCLIRNPDGNWLNEDNEELIWCYCRTRLNSPAYETEDGTNPLWRPIVPVRWYKDLPNWAREQVYPTLTE